MQNVGDKNFPKNARFITVSVQPKTIGQGLSSQPFYLTCIHLDYEYEPYRMKEIDIIKRKLDSLSCKGDNIPHMWAGDFNSLTKEDYTLEEWNEITRVRKLNCWERPHIDVTNKVR